MWESQPSIAAEIAVVQERMVEIKTVAGLGTELIFILGNHDQRLSSKISAACPELEGVHGMDLGDHLDPDWTVSWAAIANGPGINAVEFRHRHKSGHLGRAQQRPRCRTRGRLGAYPSLERHKGLELPRAFLGRRHGHD